MRIDAQELPEGTLIEADVCIVGGGVAGLTLARELADGDLDVCVLESGGERGDRDTQDLYRGDSVGHPYYPLHTARSRRLGGSSHRWLLDLGDGRMGARLRPLDAIDFERRDWVPHSGWPFGPEQLEPYYLRAQEALEAGPWLYDPSDREPEGSRWLHEGTGRLRSLGYHFVDRELFTRTWPRELEASGSVRVYTGANVLEVETDPEGTAVTGLRVATLHGRELAARASVVVLAAGGIEVPRLLLLSRSVHSPGLGNAHDLVGRFFMEHPHTWTGFYRPPERSWVRELEDYRVRNDDGVPRVAQLGVTEETLRREGLLNYSVHLVPGVRRPRVAEHTVRSAHLVGRLARSIRERDLYEFNHHLSTLVPVVGSLGVAGYRLGALAFRALFRRLRFEGFRMNDMAEQAPNPESRVLLGESRDRFGQERARLDWRLSALDEESLDRCQDIVDEELREAGLGRLEFPTPRRLRPAEIHGGWHHMGTTRMHASPRAGVVDPDGRVHGLANLYVAGPSVFPTVGCANPILTIVALTLRLADHLAGRVGGRTPLDRSDRG